MQVLGRNLEALITAAEALKAMWKDDFVSIEHLVLAAVDDPSFGSRVMSQFGVTKDSLERAIKDIRGSKRVSGTRLLLRGPLRRLGIHPATSSCTTAWWCPLGGCQQ